MHGLGEFEGKIIYGLCFSCVILVCNSFICCIRGALQAFALFFCLTKLNMP